MIFPFPLGRTSRIYAAYALRNWGTQLDLKFRPQTSELLLGADVFIDTHPKLSKNHINPSTIEVRGLDGLGELIPRLYELSEGDADTELRPQVASQLAELLCQYASGPAFEVEAFGDSEAVNQETLKCGGNSLWCG